MATLKSQNQSMLDSAIGAVVVTTSAYSGFDVDDFAHTTVLNTAIKLQMKNLVANTNPSLAANRDRVEIDGVEVGGYTGG